MALRAIRLTETARELCGNRVARRLRTRSGLFLPRFPDAPPCPPAWRRGEPPARASAVPVNATLQVEVISLLAQANISLGDQAELKRTPEGRGVNLAVEDERQRKRVMDALAPSSTIPS